MHRDHTATLLPPPHPRAPGLRSTPPPRTPSGMLELEAIARAADANALAAAYVRATSSHALRAALAPTVPLRGAR